MFKLDRHIEILLLENDCVIVPGLGGFVAHHAEASYDENDALFLPPYRTLGFNPVLQMNDSLLVQSYIEAYDLSYPAAMSEIEAEVETIQRNLEVNGEIILNGLGTLHNDKEGKITFEPYEAGILTPEFYGLSSFELNKIKATKEVEKQKVASIEDTETQKPRAIYIDINNEGEKRLNVSLKAVKDLAVAAVLLSAIFVVGFTSERQNNLANHEVKSGMFYNIFDSNDVSQSAQQTKVQTIKATPKKIENKAEHYWTLVLASHVTEDNANDFIANLKSEGYAQAHLYMGKSSTKVLYGNYKSAQQAVENLNKLRENRNFKQAWVLEIGK
ncbi:HU domain-containing protein [Prevotella disiens]|uniref:HU domain-containing protein n=1 Tax=Prevotella disiens TaxID=28130 RepID=UPI00288BFA27|nr:SPOR domain-containing protein [Prevotella disiens]